VSYGGDVMVRLRSRSLRMLLLLLLLLLLCKSMPEGLVTTMTGF
jgi:hypothetical protein